MGVLKSNAHPESLVGFKAVHVSGSSDAPSRQELDQVDLHGRLHKHKIVVAHTKTAVRQTGMF